MFKLNQVTYSVNKTTILEPTSLEFKPGKVYSLIGHNGSGKSTLLKLLARQLNRSSGDIEFNGKSLESFDTKSFAQQVAYLPQQLPQGTNLTVRELVEMGRYAWNGLFIRDKEKDNQAVQRALELTSTSKFANQLVDTLSGGQRSKVWLAMLLAQESQYLLLDEPLAALDIAHQIEVMKLITYLCRELKLGVIIVIHDINLAARFSDHIIALHSGKLLLEGSPAEIMQKEVLKQIYGIDFEIITHPKENIPVVIV